MFGGCHHQLIVGKTLIFSSIVHLHVLYHHLLAETFVMLPARHVSDLSIPTNSRSWAKGIMKKRDFYRPQTKFAKVMFLQVSVCPQGGVHGCQGVWMVAGGMRGEEGHAWQRGACVVKGGMCGKGGHAWQRRGMHGEGGHAWDTMRYGDMINERVVCILLECILVKHRSVRLI